MLAPPASAATSVCLGSPLKDGRDTWWGSRRSPDCGCLVSGRGCRELRRTGKGSVSDWTHLGRNCPTTGSDLVPECVGGSLNAFADLGQFPRCQVDALLLNVRTRLLRARALQKRAKLLGHLLNRMGELGQLHCDESGVLVLRDRLFREIVGNPPFFGCTVALRGAGSSYDGANGHARDVLRWIRRPGMVRTPPQTSTHGLDWHLEELDRDAALR